MDSSVLPVVRTSLLRGIGTVILDRPDALNAMSGQLMAELRTALQSMADDHEVRCVILRGEGRAFSAGGDTSDIKRRQGMMAEASSTGALIDSMHRQMVKDTETILLLKNMPKPTIAVVHGWAVGGGMAIALAADFRIMAKSARMRPAFIGIGLSGDFGISGLLVSSLGSARAREILLLDRTIDAEIAAELGLATLVCDDQTIVEQTDAFAAALAQGPTIALGRAKDNLTAAETHSLSELLVIESMNQRISASTTDAREASAAYAEGRSPEFQGQ